MLLSFGKMMPTIDQTIDASSKFGSATCMLFLSGEKKCEKRRTIILCSIIYSTVPFFRSTHLHCILHTSLFTYQISISRQVTEVIRCNRHLNAPVQHLRRPIIWPTCIHYLSYRVFNTNFYNKWLHRVCIREIYVRCIVAYPKKTPKK